MPNILSELVSMTSDIRIGVIMEKDEFYLTDKFSELSCTSQIALFSPHPQNDLQGKDVTKTYAKAVKPTKAVPKSKSSNLNDKISCSHVVVFHQLK